jgi:hypothetical protein
MTQHTRQELEQRFDALIGDLKDAQIQTNQGRMVDLSALQGTVEGICNDLGAAEPAIADALKPKFIEMITTLDALAGSLEGVINQEREENFKEQMRQEHGAQVIDVEESE